MDPKGNLKVVHQWWYADVGERDAWIACQYDEWSATGPISKVQIWDAAQHSVDLMQAGHLPGACPSTKSAAYEGIAWMTEQSVTDWPHRFACVANCGEITCGGTAPIPSSQEK